MSHMATALGVRDDATFQAAYWKVFEGFFGRQNAAVVKATLLAQFPKGDTGSTEIDRACFGLRQTMGWVAEAIEKKALREIGHEAPVAARSV
jgi:hypothetical protein